MHFDEDFIVICSERSNEQKPVLVQKMGCRRPGYEPLSEPVLVSLFTHICITWPQ